MYTTRPAEFEDLPRILEIYEEARAFMRASGNPNQWWDYHPAKDILLDDIPKRQLYVCESGGSICAVFAYIQGIDPTYLHIDGSGWLNDQPYGVIHRIAVSRRGQGIAAHIFDWALRQCPPASNRYPCGQYSHAPLSGKIRFYLLRYHPHL